MKFSVGEIAIVIAVKCHPENLGRECEILGPEQFWRTDIEPEGIMAYEIQVQGCPYSTISLGSELKKLPPKDTPSTWEEMEKLTGFKPRELVT